MQRQTPRKILVVGQGGREHAICRALAMPAAGEPAPQLFVAPGNPGDRVARQPRSIYPSTIVQPWPSGPVTQASTWSFRGQRQHWLQASPMRWPASALPAVDRPPPLPVWKNQKYLRARLPRGLICHHRDLSSCPTPRRCAKRLARGLAPCPLSKSTVWPLAKVYFCPRPRPSVNRLACLC